VGWRLIEQDRALAAQGILRVKPQNGRMKPQTHPACRGERVTKITEMNPQTHGTPGRVTPSGEEAH
jgi:hypothetical protein